MLALPTGTVTFLFTDVEGSTRLWERHPEPMRRAMARHDALLRAAVVAHGGHIVKTTGDGVHAAFARADQAVCAALAAQRALLAEDWGTIESIRARMALHTGAAEQRAGDYYGPTVNRAARVMSVGHGGQVLLTSAAAEVVRGDLPPGASLRDLGEHRLRDLQLRERVHQLVHPALADAFPPPRSLDELPNNLPVQLTSFVGREAEIAEAKRLLGASRLLTVTGPGGAGKTRLALQVAADVLEEHLDGVWLTELALIADEALVPAALAAALGLREEAGRPISATLVDHLRPRAALLVFDNCEHLIAACAALVDGLLRACARLRVLATSREPLGVVGETVWSIPPMAVPDPSELAAAVDLEQFAATRLFLERARAALPAFALDQHGASTVAALCRGLDGLPLAIELAAARVRAMGVEQMALRLHDRFRLLTSGPRTTVPRQQTLRALVDWSYDLLSEREQMLFGRLAAFAGGWTLAAAERICCSPPLEDHDVLDLLSRLVDKSLVVAEADQSESGRHGLLATLHAYALERLGASGELATLRDRHAAFFLDLAEDVAPRLEEVETVRWLNVLDAEHDNLRAALQWFLESNQLEQGLRLGAAMRLFWTMRGHFGEARQRLATLLERAPEAASAEHALVLDTLGFVCRYQGDYVAALPPIEQALALRRRLGSMPLVADTLSNLAAVTLLGSEPDAAEPLYGEALAIYRELGNRQGIADVQSHLARIALHRQNYAEARAMYEEALTIWRQVGDRFGVTTALQGVAAVALEDGRNDEARLLLTESLAIWRELGARWGIADALRGFAGLAVAEGKPERALRLAGAADALGRAIGMASEPIREAALGHWLARARRALSGTAAEHAWQQGRAFTLERAAEEALAVEEPTAPPDPLTPREREVAVLIARGRTNRKIADELVISERTAERHVANIMAKLDLGSRAQIAVWAANAYRVVGVFTDAGSVVRP